MLDVCTSVIIVSLIGQIGEKAFDYFSAHANCAFSSKMFI